MDRAIRWINRLVTLVTTLLLLGGILVEARASLAGDLSEQSLWIGKMSIVWAVCLLFTTVLTIKQGAKSAQVFYFAIISSLILLGGAEAFIGLRQLYGFTYSNHSLYAMTGTFFNPGPYSGYLAMTFPIALDQWLELHRQEKRKLFGTSAYYFLSAVLLMLVCVLPAGMSRSAWLAAGISGAWVYGMRSCWLLKCKRLWKIHKKRFLVWGTAAALLLLVGAVSLFNLKKDSASGRLFMWKISCLAIAEKPLTGYGYGNFARAYGAAQEAYFANGHYAPREELVAGSPEYAFNEYLWIAIEWGIPLLAISLISVGLCLRAGVRHKRTGACGGVISLMVFAFSSYPLQIPAFAVSFLFLLMACVIGRAWIYRIVFALFIGTIGTWIWKTNGNEACKEWSSCRVLYQTGAYQYACGKYEQLYPDLKDRGAFLFEYGHCLHKLERYEESTVLLKEAALRSCDPMILNIIGKNYQQQGEYREAEKWLIRSTHLLPGRIYPYYLLAKLYAEPDFNQTEKMKEMAGIVLTKEPKVQSTAIREMREEMRSILKGVK